MARDRDVILRTVRETLRAEGIAVDVELETAEPGAVRLVIGNIPRGRRPTVVRVMERLSLSWRHAGKAAPRSRAGVTDSS